MNLTAAQERAVSSLASRITVAAGPGSGKTRVLVERIVRAVQSGRLRLDRVLAITFTINAAAEMKARLSEQLPRADVEASAISTIHAFCAALLREYPVESRVDPAFRVLEEVEADVLKSRVVDELLDHIASAEPDEFAEIALHVKGRNPADTLLAGYREVMAQGGNLDDPASLLSPGDHVMYSHVARVARTLCRFHAAYTRAKDALSALDFDDLEQRVARLLANDDIAASVARRFDEVLVDEYQDTSLAQARIIHRISQRISNAGHARLFVVGDPMQSIYAFRNARPENFAEAIAAADEAIDLVEDFRSRAEVLAVVNEYFKCGLIAGSKDFPAKSRPSVELLRSETRAEEAVNIARTIHGLGADYGDIALLFRVTTDMAMYEQALSDAGIPYFSETGRGYYDTREVIDVISFLHVLDNERDEIALAAVLRSPMFGLSDDALYLLALHAHEREPKLRLCDVLGEPPALPPIDGAALARFLAVREKLAEVAVTREVASLIHEIVRLTEYESTLSERAIANVRKLEEMARVLDASSIGAGSPGEFARAVDRFRAEEVREAEAQIPMSGGAVRLMTMHAAKGLEFSIVILPDLGRPDRPEAAPIAYQAGVGLGCTFHDIDSGENGKTPTLLAIRDAKKIRNADEAQRLLFVAMTRAKDHLILCGSKASNERYKRILTMNLPAPPSAVSAAAASAAASAAATPPLAASHATPRDAPAAATPPLAAFHATPRDAPAAATPPLAAFHATPRHAPAADESDFAAAITDVAEYAACPRRYYIARYLGFSNEGARELDEDAPSARISAAERGLQVHKRLAGDTAATSADIERLARRFEESALGRRVAATPGAQREIPILAQLDGRFLHGVIDLRAGSLIVDYKTGPQDDARYALQMQLYGLLTGADELYLYYLDHDAASKIAPNPAVRDIVRTFFAAQQTLDFPAVVADHCTKCPFSGRQCLAPQRAAAAKASA